MSQVSELVASPPSTDSVIASWSQGTMVPDIMVASPDAEFLIDYDELDSMSWRKLSVQVKDVKLHYPLGFLALPGESQPEADARWQNIRDWLRSTGGILSGLNQSPILAELQNDGSVAIIDGWHRLAIAVLEYGLAEVPMLVGAYEMTLRALLANSGAQPSADVDVRRRDSQIVGSGSDLTYGSSIMLAQRM